MHKMGGLFLYNFFVDKWLVIWYTESDLWITYEEGEVGYELKISNWIASYFQLPYLPRYTLSKWSNKSMQKNPRAYVTLQFFTFFPAIYSTYNGSARKNRAGFSHVRVCGLGWKNFPPVIYAYIQSRRRCANKQDRRGGSNQLWIYIT